LRIHVRDHGTTTGVPVFSLISDPEDRMSADSAATIAIAEALPSCGPAM
jgi:hypothetical protein